MTAKVGTVMVRAIVSSNGPSAGSRVMFCSDECGSRWTLAKFVTNPGMRVETVEVSGRECAHCSWCGVQAVFVAADGVCLAHGDPRDCAGFDYRVTERCERVVAELLRRSGLVALPPRAWTYLDGAAAALQVRCGAPVDDVVATVWSLRIDWLPAGH